MKKLFAILFFFGFAGVVSAQDVPQTTPQQTPKYASVGFDLGSGINTWANVAGKGGFGQMNFNPGQQPLVSSFAENKYGNVSVYAAPWANGTVTSGKGGSGSVSASFRGGGSAYMEHNKGMGTWGSSNISKSVNLSASSSGNGSATVNGGFDASANVNIFARPPKAPVPVVPGKG